MAIGNPIQHAIFQLFCKSSRRRINFLCKLLTKVNRKYVRTTTYISAQ